MAVRADAQRKQLSECHDGEHSTGAVAPGLWLGRFRGDQASCTYAATLA